MITVKNTKIYDICDNDQNYDFTSFLKNPTVIDNMQFNILPIGVVLEIWLNDKIQMEIKFRDGNYRNCEMNLVTVGERVVTVTTITEV